MKAARWIAAGFGTGFAPVAPGTVASAAAVLIGTSLLWWWPTALAVAILLAVGGGLWAIPAAGVEGDPRWVVIDEFAGQWIAMLGAGAVAPVPLLLAFVLFRVLDVTKPGPIGRADRWHGAFGIMADDVIAGAIAAVIVWAARAAWRTTFG